MIKCSHFSRVVWMENIWCVLGRKTQFSDFSGVVWTGHELHTYLCVRVMNINRKCCNFIKLLVLKMTRPYYFQKYLRCVSSDNFVTLLECELENTSMVLNDAICTNKSILPNSRPPVEANYRDLTREPRKKTSDSWFRAAWNMHLTDDLCVWTSQVK